MKYLMDSLQSFESGHGDALHPVPSGCTTSFIGEHLEVQAVTAGEMRELKRSIDQQFDEVVGRVTAVLASTHMPSLITPVHGGSQCGLPTHIARARPAPYHSRSTSVSSDNGSDPPAIPCSTLTLSISPDPPAPSKQIPNQSARIPDLKAGAGAWRGAIQQWEDGDINIGLLPLRDWPEAWYKGEMRTVTGKKRRDRELVAIAYDR